MSTNKREQISENRAANMITDLNLELKMFLEKFSNFKKDYNVTDINLFTNLEMVYEEIADFVNGNPLNVNTENRTNIDLKTLKQNGILKIYVCDICQLEIGEKSSDILKHIEEMHAKTNNTGFKNDSIGNRTDRSRTKANAKMEVDNKKKGQEKNKTRNERSFPKKAKTFISGDFGIFLDNASKIGRKLLEIPEYKLIEQSLYDCLLPAFPDMKVYFFGSRMNGLSNANSDLDVFLDVGNIYHTYKQKTNADKKINKVENLLRKSTGNEWKRFKSVKKARVPILRAYFVSDDFKVDCDISFSHGLGHLNTLLMKYFFELQPICYKMCLFLKQWMKSTNITDFISTYSLVLLTVFYLQVKKLLPSVKALQDDIKTPIIIGPWQGDFIEKSLSDLNIEKVEDTNKKCFEFLKDFFKYYSKFEFKTLIVCPYLGRAISKSSLHDTEYENIPRYKAYFMEDPKENAFQTSKPVCVMDPLELNHNVTKGISENWLQSIKQYCNETFDKLESRG